MDAQTIKPAIFTIPTIPSVLELKDYLGAIKVRWGIGRDNYTVTPGLYKVGKPDSTSDVFVSANYKLSFDILRKNLNSLNAWILVIDTKGINVWCAAGKGTFGTDNLVKSIKTTSLENIVKHRNIIVPQLGAVGVASHTIKEQTGFKVIYGPIQAKQIKAFVDAGYKATPEMRKINFPFIERAKLVPVDFMYGKYKLLIGIAFLFFLSGLDRTGFIFLKMINTCFYPIINIVGAYICGIVIAPMFLPFIPLRAFALKGAFWALLFTGILNLFFQANTLELLSMSLINLSVASFMTMNFTGSSTYTSLSGVKKEMNWAIPFQIAFALIGIILYIISKVV